MFNLIMLEAKKYSFKRNILLSSIVSLGLFLGVFFIARDTGIPLNHLGLHDLLSFFTNSAYFVFAGLIFAKHLIGEYEVGTITVLFSYPQKRVKIMMAKLIYVFSFVIIVTCISFTVNLFLFYGAHMMLNSSNVSLELSDLLKSISSLLYQSVRMNVMHGLTIFIGLKFKTSIATIVTSIICVSIVAPLLRMNTAAWLAWLPLLIGIIGFLGIMKTWMKIEEEDVL